MIKEKMPKLETIQKIRQQIHPYDLVVFNDMSGRLTFVFRKPDGEYNGLAEELIIRGYSLAEYKRVYSEKEAVEEVKRIRDEKNT